MPGVDEDEAYSRIAEAQKEIATVLRKYGVAIRTHGVVWYGPPRPEASDA